MDGILYAFATVVGVSLDKVTYRPPANVLEEAMAVTTRLRPTLARALLGWEPRKAGLVDGMVTYLEAYKGSISTLLY